MKTKKLPNSNMRMWVYHLVQHCPGMGPAVLEQAEYEKLLADISIYNYASFSYSYIYKHVFLWMKETGYWKETNK